MGRPLALAGADAIASRLRSVPDEVWDRRALLWLAPTVLTAAYVVVLRNQGIDARAIAATFAQIGVFTACVVLSATTVRALVPGRAAALAERSPAAALVGRGLGLGAGIAAGVELGLALLRVVGVGVVAGRPALYGLALVFGALAEGLATLFRGVALRAEQGELRAEQARREAVEARLAALRARTNPHFLFNSLNAIAGLVGIDAERAERAIETLSESMRYALESTEMARVPLARELAAVRNHVELERLRYGDALRAELRVEEGLGNVPVPPLCLQPVVENAIVHGVSQREGGGALTVSARREGESLVLRVEDDGPGPRRSARAGTGTALADLRTRLALLYGAAASLRVEGRDGGGCRVELRIPLHPAAAAGSAPGAGPAASGAVEVGAGGRR